MWRKNLILHDLGFEIFHSDLPHNKLWKSYQSMCLELEGDGWRAPTLVELRCMYELRRLRVMGFRSGPYWSGDIPLSSRGDERPAFRYCISFFGDSSITHRQNINLTYNFFRPVRSI